MKIVVINFFLLLALACGNAIGGEGETYLFDLTKLDQKILDTEKAISMNQGQIEILSSLEILKEKLVTMKSNYQSYHYDIKLQDQIEFANNKKWKNISAYLGQIEKACQPSTDKQERYGDECFLRLAGFKEFIKGRSILDHEREELSLFAELYSKKLESKMVLNEQFFIDLNNVIEKTQLAFTFKTAPLVTVTMKPQTKINHPIVVRMENQKASSIFNIYWKKLEIMQVGIVFLLTLVCAGGMLFINQKRKIKKVRNFYSKIYFSAKKNNVKLKIFGHLKNNELNILSKVEQNIIEVMNSASCIANRAVMRVKRNSNQILLETKLEDVNGIQEKLGTLEAELLTSKLNALQQKTQALGGELLFTELYNEKGENTSSSYSIVFPS